MLSKQEVGGKTSTNRRKILKEKTNKRTNEMQRKVNGQTDINKTNEKRLKDKRGKRTGRGRIKGGRERERERECAVRSTVHDHETKQGKARRGEAKQDQTIKEPKKTGRGSIGQLSKGGTES